MSQRCAQMEDVAQNGRYFPSSSSDKVYKVTAFRSGEWHFCNCPAYIFQRSKQAKKEGVHQNEIQGWCKHLEQVFKQTCQWRAEPGDHRRWDRCPTCGGDVVEEGSGVQEKTSSAKSGAQDEVEDLQALLRELRGSDAEPAELSGDADQDAAKLLGRVTPHGR